MEKTLRLIILAAGQGTRLRPLTNNQPKCLIELNGRSILQWQIDTAKECGINDITVVGGYLAQKLSGYPVTLIENIHYSSTNMVRSLMCASSKFGNGFIMSYGDIVYSKHVLNSLLKKIEPISVVVDKSWRGYWDKRFDDPLQDAETLKFKPDGSLLEIGKKPKSYDEIEGQYIGLVQFQCAGVSRLMRVLDAARDADSNGHNPFNSTRNLNALYMTDLLQGMIDDCVLLNTCNIDGEWLEIDSISDLKLAERLLTKGRLG